jgi:opacity protein-like surface antigen
MSLNKKHIIILAASIFIHTAAIAEDNKEQSPYYIRLDAGLSQPNGKLNEDDYSSQRLLRGEFYGVGAGYIFNSNIRTDLTLTARSNYKFSYSGTEKDEDSIDTTTVSNQNFSSTTLMLNAYYNIPVNNVFSPYINVGIGGSRISTGRYYSTQSQPGESDIISSSSSSKNYNLAYTIGLGAQVKLNNNFSLDTFFRYIDLGKTKRQNISQSSNNNTIGSSNIAPFLLQSYELGISLIYRF